MDKYAAIGFFEDWLDVGLDYPKDLGTMPVANMDSRQCGYEGFREFTLIAPVVLDKGHKKVKINASRKRPLSIRTYLNIFGGKP